MVNNIEKELIDYETTEVDVDSPTIPVAKRGKAVVKSTTPVTVRTRPDGYIIDEFMPNDIVEIFFEIGGWCWAKSANTSGYCMSAYLERIN